MKKPYPYLTYAGAIPFFVCAVCLLFQVKTLPLLGEVKTILSVYALIIVTFLAGSHWGQHLHLKDRWSHTLAIASNIIAVVLWLTFLTVPFKTLLIVIGVVFSLLLFIDKKLFQYHHITRHYFYTRCTVTVMVISTLTISVIAS